VLVSIQILEQRRPNNSLKCWRSRYICCLSPLRVFATENSIKYLTRILKATFPELLRHNLLDFSKLTSNPISIQFSQILKILPDYEVDFVSESIVVAGIPTLHINFEIRTKVRISTVLSHATQKDRLLINSSRIFLKVLLV
jgi:hypothetical protein